MNNLSPVYEKRWIKSVDEPILEWTLDGNIRMTYCSKYGDTLWRTFEVEDGVVDLTGMKDEFVEDNLLEPVKKRGFEVVYQTEDEPTPSLIQRIVRFITP